MKIKIRQTKEKTIYEKDPITNVETKKIVNVETGFIEELDVNPKDISAFSMVKSVRLIGIGKKLHLLTLKSWKETKKELSNIGILSLLDHSKPE